MGEIPLYQKPFFRSIILGLLLSGIYIYNLVWGGGILANLLGIALDVLMLVLLLQLCVFFYAQFILPIRTLEDRKKIASRLWLHAGHGHGPAIFIKNGRKVERAGESDKRGPGVLWVDTASAAVTRTFTTFKQVLGPGVHFTEASEKIATIISLHTQIHVIGPTGDDAPFEKPGENASPDEQDEYEQVQARRMAVSARTRDGIEVVPTIRITFKIDAKPAGADEKGSRFGFDREAVEKAARGEGINPNSTSAESRYVAWNQLPAMIAADLWREYLSKFTLSELFDPSLNGPPEVPQPIPPLPPIEAPKRPLLIRRNYFANVLRKINDSFEQRLDQLIPKEEPPVEQEFPPLASEGAKRLGETKHQTALQTINQMMQARMSQAVVARLDECGRVLEGHEISDEYKKLKERGIAVFSIHVSGLHFEPTVESQLLQRWNTNWLSTAKDEQDRIERLDLVYAEKGRQKALLDHAFTLSEALSKERITNISAAVKVLLQKTQSEIKLNDRFLSRLSSEPENLEELVKWVETKDL